MMSNGTWKRPATWHSGASPIRCRSGRSNSMSSEPLILAVDNGTQSVRALLFDAQGNLIAKGKQEIQPYFSERPGWAEQQPEYFWDNLGKACEQLWQSTDITPDRV